MHGPIGDWDVSGVMDISRIFSVQMSPSAAVFNDDISKWDVPSVKNMYDMFNTVSTPVVPVPIFLP